MFDLHEKKDDTKRKSTRCAQVIVRNCQTVWLDKSFLVFTGLFEFTYPIPETKLTNGTTLSNKVNFH